MAGLSLEDMAVFKRASEAQSELRARWNALGVPPEGQAGLALALFVEICVKDRKMTLAQVIRDFSDCIATTITPGGSDEPS